MAMTNTQRATLYATLAETIGQQEAETLMEQLPPSGWDQVATKDDLRVLGANFAAALAETNAAIVATNAAMTAGFAETNAAMKAGLAEAAKERAETDAAIVATNAAMTAGFAETNAAIVATNAAMTAGFAETNAAMKAGLAEAAKERAEIVKSQLGSSTSSRPRSSRPPCRSG